MNIYRYTFFALLAALTACSDNDFAGSTTSDEISFSVSSTSSWQDISNNAAEGNAVHSRSNIPGTDYSIHSIIEPSTAADSRAAEINNTLLQEKGFNVTAVVKENTSGTTSLLMNDTKISHSGGSWTYSPVKYWPNVAQYTTTFYAYRLDDFKSKSTESDGCTPILTYTVPTAPTQQKDVIAAKYDKNDRGKVDFNLRHLLTAVKIKTRNIDRPILRIEFTGIHDSGDFHLSTMSWSNVGYSATNPKGEFKYSFVGSEWIGKPSSGSTETYVTDANGSEIYFMMIPQNLADTNARVRILFENGTIIESPLKENWEAGKTVTYVVSYDSVTCQWLDDSNSYIISPIDKNNKNVNLFAIPISFRINTFWQNEGGGVKPLVGGTSYVAEVIWQDSPSRVINFTNATGTTSTNTYAATIADGGGDNEYVYFKLAKPDFTGTSNVVVGVRLKDADTYLWSWHLWITDYYPLPEYQAYTLTSAARIEVPNGYIERYDDSNIAGAGAAWASLPKRYLMDRNIGAKGSCNVEEITEENYKNTFGMYYQFGRKDPFPPNGILYRMESDGTIKNLGTLTNTDASTIVPTNKNIPFNGTELWPVVKTVQYPMEFVVSNEPNSHTYNSGNWRNPSWYAAGKDDGSKSFYDPCPPGWRVPNGTIFNIFGQKYNSKETFQVSEENDKLKIGNQVIGYKYYIDKAGTTSTNYYIWVNRNYADGVLLDDILVNNFGNSLIWRSESFGIFQLFIQYYVGSSLKDGLTNLYNTCNMECYGAQVRAIHE